MVVHNSTVRHTLCETELFVVKIASTLEEMEAALRLRYEVFNLEMNEGLQSSHETGFDSDVYDTFCDHLIVVERRSGAVVGTYRLLPQSTAVRQIGFYSENEFDLSAFRTMNGEMLEVGRSCVAKPFRSLAVINLLWNGIARYMEMNGVTHLFGCASFHTSDPRIIAAATAYLRKYHPAPHGMETVPVPKCRMELPFHLLTDQEIEGSFRHFPPLVKGYLRLGASVCGDPAYDAEFGTTDVLILLHRESITSKYKEHFLRTAAAA